MKLPAMIMNIDFTERTSKNSSKHRLPIQFAISHWEQNLVGFEVVRLGEPFKIYETFFSKKLCFNEILNLAFSSKLFS